jgi:ribosomal protein S18 acetylase RimI-like enzyme
VDLSSSVNFTMFVRRLQARASFAFLFWLQSTAFAFDIHIQPASKEDVATARRILLSEAMNPLAVSQDRLLVAKVVNAEDKDSSALNDLSMRRQLAGFAQIRPLGENFSELSSLYVLPQYRRRGIATQLISALLARHEDEYKASARSDGNASRMPVVCLLTLRPTVPLYEKHGFHVVSKNDLPATLQLEFAAGAVISAVLGNDLVAMKLDPSPQEATSMKIQA